MEIVDARYYSYSLIFEHAPDDILRSIPLASARPAPKIILHNMSFSILS